MASYGTLCNKQASSSFGLLPVLMLRHFQPTACVSAHGRHSWMSPIWHAGPFNQSSCVLTVTCVLACLSACTVQTALRTAPTIRHAWSSCAGIDGPLHYMTCGCNMLRASPACQTVEEWFGSHCTGCHLDCAPFLASEVPSCMQYG